MRSRRVAGLMVAATMISGCSSTTENPISIAFDDLTNETRSGKADYVNFSSFVSVSGIVPAHPLQGFSYQSDDLPPTHALGMSPKWTFRVKRHYAMDQSEAAQRDAVADIRSQYVALRAKATELGAENAAVAIGRATLALPDEPTDEARKRLEIAGRALGLGEGTATRQTVGAELDDKVKQLEPLSKAVSSMRDQLEKDLKRWNILLTRWSTSTQSTAKADAEKSARAAYERARSTSGVVILGNLLVESLHVGEDIFDLLRELNQGPKALFAATRITTFEVKARHVAFVADEDFSRAISAYLDLDATEVAALATTVRNAAIRAQIALSAMAAFGGSGLLASTRTETQLTPFYPPLLLQRGLEKLVKEDSGYESIYVVRAQFNDLVAERLPNLLCTHLQRVTENVDDPHAAAASWLKGIGMPPAATDDPAALFAGTRYARDASRIPPTTQCSGATAGAR